MTTPGEVTSEQLQVAVRERLDAGVPKKTIVSEIMGIRVLVPVDGQFAPFQMDQSSATTYVDQSDALRKSQKRHGAILSIAVGIGLLALSIGPVALVFWLDAGWKDWLENWMDENPEFAIAGIVAIAGLVLTGLLRTITGFLRLLTTIGSTDSVLTRSKNAAMKVVHKLNGSEDL